MNLQRCLSFVLLLCVCLSVLFSPLHTVYATDEGVSLLNLDEEDYSNGSIQFGQSFYLNNYATGVQLFTECTLSQDVNISGSYTFGGNFSPDIVLADRVSFRFFDNSRMFSAGSKVNINYSNIVNFFQVRDTYYYFNPNSVYFVRVWFHTIDGTTQHVDLEEFDISAVGRTYTLNFTIPDVPCDTYGINVDINYNSTHAYMTESNVSWSSTLNTNYRGEFTRFGGCQYSYFSFDETKADETAGLLKTIIQYVINIWNGITNLPSLIANAIKGFFDNIVNAVVNLGTFLLDGIKGLFVPSEEDIVEMKEKFEQLLADRFGAMYQVVQCITDYASAFTESEKKTITFPTVSIPLGEANFEFGGWEVQVVPDGFSVLIDALKLIISISCTLLFVNGMKNRFDKLIGGSENI